MKWPTIVKYSKAALCWKKIQKEIVTIKDQEKCSATQLQEGKYNIDHCFMKTNGSIIHYFLRTQ